MCSSCFSSIVPEHNSMVGNFISSDLLFYIVIGIFNARLVSSQIMLGEKFHSFHWQLILILLTLNDKYRRKRNTKRETLFSFFLCFFLEDIFLLHSVSWFHGFVLSSPLLHLSFLFTPVMQT